jgi:hypothetical protein
MNKPWEEILANSVDQLKIEQNEEGDTTFTLDIKENLQQDDSLKRAVYQMLEEMAENECEEDDDD